MNLAGFFKKKNSKDSDNVIKFLNKVDDLYMTAIEKKDTRYLGNYFSREVIRYVEELIHIKDFYFGLPKYRKRSWQLLDSSDEIMLFRKELTHDHIKVTSKVYVPLGEDLVEFWELKIVDSNLVVNIRPE